MSEMSCAVHLYCVLYAFALMNNLLCMCPADMLCSAVMLLPLEWLNAKISEARDTHKYTNNTGRDRDAVSVSLRASQKVSVVSCGFMW